MILNFRSLWGFIKLWFEFSKPITIITILSRENTIDKPLTLRLSRSFTFVFNVTLFCDKTKLNLCTHMIIFWNTTACIPQLAYFTIELFYCSYEQTFVNTYLLKTNKLGKQNMLWSFLFKPWILFWIESNFYLFKFGMWVKLVETLSTLQRMCVYVRVQYVDAYRMRFYCTLSIKQNETTLFEKRQ